MSILPDEEIAALKQRLLSIESEVKMLKVNSERILITIEIQILIFY
jgi:hypothetical protein